MLEPCVARGKTEARQPSFLGTMNERQAAPRADDRAAFFFFHRASSWLYRRTLRSKVAGFPIN
jgi:hypothetical protein